MNKIKPLYIEDGQLYPFSTDSFLDGTYRPLAEAELREYFDEIEKVDGDNGLISSIMDKYLVKAIKSWNLESSAGNLVVIDSDALKRIGPARSELISIILLGKPATRAARAIAAKQEKEEIENYDPSNTFNAEELEKNSDAGSSTSI